MNAMVQRMEAALAALKRGEIIIVMDDESRENEGDMIMAAEFCDDQDMNTMIRKAGGLVCAPISTEIAKRLDLTPMVVKNEDEYQTAFTVTVDFIATHTGISAAERALTCRKLAAKETVAADFKRPGHIFPLIAKDGGVLVRRGHTEASVDLMKLAGLTEAAVICEILKEDGTMARHDDLLKVSQAENMPFITIEDIVNYRHHLANQAASIEPLSHAHLPTAYGNFEIYTFPNSEGEEPHVVLRNAQYDDKSPLTMRIHSECLTGDIFHSVKCDCQAQLDFGLKTIADDANGMMIYLRQEGRGIGLAEKIRAYALQDQGQNTIVANVSLGHPVDARDFTVAAQILKYFDQKRVRIITNNPEKVAALEANGIEVVERVPTPRFVTKENQDYLTTKATEMGHYL
ncbi:bifunctional 3,4-dihydroxy-2-butanone-4-phosphate synthase/GTP cyclohydrolase II [Wohlfahrtiimonas chitiniclastica]|uniref:bifunctional 3,4-dihydroxy-2-butanone-4-phosphate synthase/GTP cyclohydrolase II n=1 Tax=Wohlfahrtiimonas chitiniclastica TaxID=400946 RepID=UPI0003640A9A|nr:bifunctional 3,4-dihydroxy-2-butanone-4-phosphate synthase/GTP cyclohydrolase II [Wohlfahrtiimonas chitiniclastica]KZX36573.1 bifunctional 3,4-dihydroxy-2-butanone 4-phosphate synthase/GTP cyclohydrolase II [Wohlfahrtiimonas chitiniclastica]MBS7814451.1 bifunctional 3,4-dihydroxy-2-butanone-4-phosphate synthase/GTP cyclohydrolase II [Wohlfahrtiimonas chitiniclastica]MBS7838180.1 bifunctional 3,4-dihydroxy-2-butanone-4-phosphate synthase/GTP cyclohydrolase II [Wohlfahrtiimonas chitiniclastica]